MALDSGFLDCIYKPIDPTKTNAVMFEALKLDSSDRYFSTSEDYVLFELPSELTPFVISDISIQMGGEAAEADVFLYDEVSDEYYYSSYYILVGFTETTHYTAENVRSYRTYGTTSNQVP